MGFDTNDMVPLLLFKAEYEFIQKILKINSETPELMGMLGQIILPYLALSSYETSKWIEHKSNQNLYSDFDLLSKKRNLFKYFDDSAYSVKDFDLRCQNMLVAASRCYKGPVGAFGFMKEDAAVMLMDDIEVGSTFTCFRYLYDDALDQGISVDQDLINERAKDIGFIIGQHAAALVGLMKQFDESDYCSDYSLPKLPDAEYNFFFSKIKQAINRDNDRGLANGMLVVLADAYYSLGMSKVLSSHNIISNLVFVKMNLLSLYHLKTSIDKVVACSYRDSNFPLSQAFRSDLTNLYSRAEKEVLAKCEPLRHTLVHYNLPKGISLQSHTLEALNKEILNCLTFNSGLTWEELSEELVRMGESVRNKLGQLVGMSVW